MCSSEEGLVFLGSPDFCVFLDVGTYNVSAA